MSDYQNNPGVRILRIFQPEGIVQYLYKVNGKFSQRHVDAHKINGEAYHVFRWRDLIF